MGRDGFVSLSVNRRLLYQATEPWQQVNAHVGEFKCSKCGAGFQQGFTRQLVHENRYIRQYLCAQCHGGEHG